MDSLTQDALLGVCPFKSSALPPVCALGTVLQDVIATILGKSASKVQLLNPRPLQDESIK